MQKGDKVIYIGFDPRFMGLTGVLESVGILSAAVIYNVLGLRSVPICDLLVIQAVGSTPTPPTPPVKFQPGDLCQINKNYPGPTFSPGDRCEVIYWDGNHFKVLMTSGLSTGFHYFFFPEELDSLPSAPSSPNLTALTGMSQRGLEVPHPQFHREYTPDCTHDYVTYTGLREEFEYCKHCDHRKGGV